MKRRQLLLGAVLPAALATQAQAQVTFSIDFGGPTIGVPDSSWAVPITEGDLLQPFNVGGAPATLGTLPPPGISRSAGFGPPIPGLVLPSHGGCVGHPPGLFGACAIEVNAMSAGNDHNLDPAVPYMPGANLLFSVDNMSTGAPGSVAPEVFSEALAGDAAADVFGEIGLQPVPMPPGFSPFGNVGILDGDGLPSGPGWRYPALGLVEPTPPGPWPTLGDELDALDVNAPIFPLGPVYFSLEGPFPEPLTGAPASGSAPANGVSGADVLLNPGPGAPPVIWAPATALGLDLIGGPNSDDIDALAIWENGDGVFTPSVVPFDWATGVGTDMVLFSVRRGSAVIGIPDSLLGVPISEADILTTPAAPGLPPGILFAAENFGLAPGRMLGAMWGDDLDALDTQAAPLFDCDGSGLEDALDIAFGFQPDTNLDGVPDACQLVVAPYAFGVACPCGNVDPFAGCANSTGRGALLAASGSSVWNRDDLVLHVTQGPPGQFGIFFMGTNTGSTFFGDGLLGVAGTIQRWAIVGLSPAGSASYGPGLIAISGGFPASGQVLPGQTWHFQYWYRDGAPPCGTGFNTTNALSVTFLP